MCNEIIRCAEKVVDHDFALIILEVSIVLHLLYSHTQMGKLAMVSKSFPLLLGNGVHVQHVPLASTELCKDEVMRPRTVDACTLDEYVVGSPSIVDPYCRLPVIVEWTGRLSRVGGAISPSNPERYDRRVILPRELFHQIPWLGVRQAECVS
jgi:hypothetical protein